MPRIQRPLSEAHADDCVTHTFGPDACDCGHLTLAASNEARIERRTYIVAIWPDEVIPVHIAPDADPISLMALIDEIEEGDGTFIYRTEEVEIR